MDDRQRLGRFILLGKLGEGGMGVVYKARDTVLNREVAIKVLPVAKAGDSERRARLLQEARAASALRHPNIVTIHDIGEESGQQYVVMELVDGKPLSERIPRDGMRLAEVLKTASQVAGALTAAHAAGIVHRDLKPANIMMDDEGRVKVLDFGIAKLAGHESAEGDEGTLTAGLTVEGAIIGSASYMSPEQAQGRKVDPRSDIFSFGSLVYEMLTGKQAFPGESALARMAAVVEREPAPLADAAPGTPPELERLVSRCMRKDLARRSQSIADVKLALDELREDSDSGRQAAPSTPAVVVAPAPAPPATAAPTTVPPAPRRWLWPVVAAACVVMAVAIAWALSNRRGGDAPAVPEMVRLSPDDGHSYTEPAISPDGKLVAYVSNRGGKNDIWLQQAGGGQPIQVTRSQQTAISPSFLPDGTQLVYVTGPKGVSVGVPDSLEIVPAFGGTPRVLTKGVIMSAKASPDGRSVLFFEGAESTYHLATIPVEGGPVKRLDAWRRMQRGGIYFIGATWSPDSRSILAEVPAPGSGGERDVYVFPVDGGEPSPTGIVAAFRAAGVRASLPSVILGERGLFTAAKGNEALAAWELRLDPGSWRPRGTPRRLTFGTEPLLASSVSLAGVVATESARFENDFHLIAMDWRTGHAVAPARRLTRDGRSKMLVTGGDPALAYGLALAGSTRSGSVFSVDLTTASQTALVSGIPFLNRVLLSRDGKLMALSRGGDNAVSLLPVGAPLAAARQLCSKCGATINFSPDGRYLLYDPAVSVNDPKPKRSLGLIEVATGKATPWLEDAVDSIGNRPGFLASGEWFRLTMTKPGSDASPGRFVVPWRVPAPPRSEWVEYSIPIPQRTRLQSLHDAPFIHYFDGPKLMAIRFDPKVRRFGEPFAVRFPRGHESDLQPGDAWQSRGPGIVFARQERTGSVWLMKLPE